MRYRETEWRGRLAAFLCSNTGLGVIALMLVVELVAVALMLPEGLY